MRCIACILDDGRHCEVRLLIDGEVSYARLCEDFREAEAQAARWQRVFVDEISGTPAITQHRRIQ
jgi:hypothetical protein